jgi:methylase of polypeptide subunit release factors
LSTSDTTTRALSSLRAVLERAGYTADAIRESTSIGDVLSFPELRSVAQLAYLEREVDDPLATLIAMFALGADAPRTRLEKAAPELDLDELERLEVVRREGDRLAPVLRIDEFDGLHLFSDNDVTRPEYVMGMSPSTTLTAVYTPRPAVGTALDVGTGSGVHALLAARHADRVVATDISRRALRITRLNAALNGLDNVETREGSFLEPVEGERFDLIVTNPPYVISPDTSFLFRDAGKQRDSLCRTLLAELPRHLKDGGFATLQCNWVHGANQSWTAPIGAGLSSSGCAAWIVRVLTETPLQYAARWPQRQHRGDPEGYDATLRRWQEHHREAGIEAITLAMVILRRRDGARNWRCAVTAADLPEKLIGKQMAQLFETQDRLAELDDDALLGAGVTPAPGLEVTRLRRVGERPRCVLSAQSAMGSRRQVTPALGDVVERLNGTGTLRDSMAIDNPPPLDDVRALIRLGFVLLD